MRTLIESIQVSRTVNPPPRLAFREIRRWRRQLLVRKFSVKDQPSHLQTPAHVSLDVTVHEPHTCERRQIMLRASLDQVNIRSVSMHAVHVGWVLGRPGLSAKNLMATQPPAGTPTVFLSTGSTRLKLVGSFAGS